MQGTGRQGGERYPIGAHGVTGLADGLLQTGGSLARGGCQSNAQRFFGEPLHQGQDAGNGPGLAGSGASGNDKQGFEQGQGGGGELIVHLLSFREQVVKELGGRFGVDFGNRRGPFFKTVGHPFFAVVKPVQVEPVFAVQDERGCCLLPADYPGGEQFVAPILRVRENFRIFLREQAMRLIQGQADMAPVHGCRGQACSQQQLR